ncbi:MAG: DUF378 domain-containing protein [Candidatus Nealsonbacteria bacterium]
MKVIGLTAFILVIIGALNWGLIGFFKFDLVATLFGEMTTITRVIYGLVGLAAIAKLVMCKKHCCKTEKV